MYYEGGCAFAGMWNSIDGEDHYSLEGTKKEIEDQLPEELNECFGITECMEEETEELSEWINDALEAKKTKKKEAESV
jgi:ppGpp synthetase/RelA/SpoT-type nucleotidyltranferase